MDTNKGQASLFLFTSFQGGIGKSSLAWRFAQAYQTLTNSQGIFFEFNLLSPSWLVEKHDLSDKAKSSFIDFFMSNWQGFLPQHLHTAFHDHRNILLIPFCGTRSRETLKSPFVFDEKEAIPALEKLLSAAAEKKMFVVFDIAMAMTPLPLYLLKRSDSVNYLYSAHSPSPSFAKRFRFEAERFLGEDLSKISFLRNLVNPKTDDLDFCLFDREYPLPDTNTLEEKDREVLLDTAIQKLVKNAISMRQNGAKPIEVIGSEDLSQEKLREYKRQMRSTVVSELERGFGLSDAELRRRVEEGIENAMKRVPPPLLSGIDVPSETRRFLLDEILGLGPIEEFMRDPEVDEIMVNGPNCIFIEKQGCMVYTGKTFNNNDHVKTVIDRILMSAGRTVNERTPYVDARLPDGSRVHAIIPPLSLTGPMITIRRFSHDPYSLEDLIFRFKTLSPEAGEFLKMCVKFRRNIIVSGGAGSGKTTLLNVLSSSIPSTERIIVIEDSAELRLAHQNMGRLEARQQGTEAKNQVTIRDLLRNALRMRPDRIIIGECRGAEALDMLQAMNTGHDGSLTTLHANTTRDALARLETMVLMAGVDLPLRAIREQIASSVNIIVQMTRFSDGSRRCIEIAEVTGIEDTNLQTQPIFQFEKRWINENGTVFGDIIPTGHMPTFLRKMPSSVLEKAAKLFAAKE